MPLSKLQLKARLFEILEPLRKLSAVDEKIINGAIEQIKSIKDVDLEFVSKLLIKEADSDMQKAATAFIYVAEHLSPKKFLEFITEELRSKKVSDDKKFFLINLLSGLGINFDAQDIGYYLSNPEAAIDRETAKFLENAQTDPEAQIDFLDFYYSSTENEKKSLLHTVFNDFDENKILNIMVGLMLSETDENAVLYCLEYVEKITSPLLERPLLYLMNSKSEKISKKASKLYRKMYMKGLFNKINKNKFYSNFFKEFEKPESFISIPDGNSNFSIVISRKSKKGFCELLFIAVNTSLGPFSCFGFSNLTIDDYNSIIDRFFNNSTKIPLEIEVSKKILLELTLKRIALGKTIPYEYFCWERIAEDIIPDKENLSEILTFGLEKVSLDDFSKKIILKSPYIKNWFFKSSKNNFSYVAFISKIENLKNENITDIEEYVEEYSKNRTLLSVLKQRILFLAFALKKNKTENLANLYFSSLFNDEFLTKFLSEILRKSVLEHFRGIEYLKKLNQNFLKNNSKINVNTDMFLSYINKNWSV